LSSNDKIPLIDFTTPCTYTIWARSYPGNAAGDSLYVGLGEQTVSLTGFEPGDWGWANQAQTGGSVELTIAQSGLYTLSVVMREDGLRLDRLLLTTNTTYLPTGFGPVESVRQTSQMTGALTTLQRTVTYNYDKLYHLTSANYTSGEQYSYTYDPVGNRLQQIINGDTTGYLYDAADRLTSVNGQTYAFDDNGNLLTTGAMTNTWDAANRLIEATNAGATLQPIYDGQGNRVAQTSDLITTSFALDVQGLPEVIYTSEDNAYLHLPGIMMTESATGTVRYLLSDGLGSVRQAVDEDATVVSYKEFDPYGNPIENGKSEIGNRYGYAGEWWEDEVGLLYLRARWYMPETGIFLSRDAMEGEPSYLYVRGNPINLTDPTGLFPEWCRVKSSKIEYADCVLRHFGLHPATMTAFQALLPGPTDLTLY
jgi:RHS repeat-associated protein